MVMLWVEYELWREEHYGERSRDFTITVFECLLACSLCFIPIFLYVLADSRPMNRVKTMTCIALVVLTVWAPFRFIFWALFF